MKQTTGTVIFAAMLALGLSSRADERIDDLFLRGSAQSGVSAVSAASDSSSGDGVTKRRLGSLTRNDMVVTDVSGGGGGGGAGCDTNAVVDIAGKAVISAIPVRIGPYLWETTTPWEDFSAATNRFATRFPSYGKCTGVCNSRYHGRNLDWYYDRGATVVVRSPGRDGKYAVIGVSSGVVPDAVLSSNKWDDAYLALPFSLSDGMNECGVVIQQNVVQRSSSSSTWPVNWHENREGSLISFVIIRYALDRCSTALEAALLIKERTFIPDEFDYDFHFQVSDRYTSYIVEDGEIYEDMDVPTDVMTNFRVGGISTNGNGTVVWHTVETYGIGVERYDSVRTNGFNKSTLSGMISTMKSLWYTRAYETNTVPYWYTEHCDPKTPALTVMAAKDHPELFEEQVRSWYGDYIAEHMEGGPRYRAGKTWQTVHTAIYDKNDLNFVLLNQENPRITRLFTLLDDGGYAARTYIPYFENYATNNYWAARLANYRAKRLEYWQAAVSNDLLLVSATNGIKRSVYFSVTNEQLVATVADTVTNVFPIVTNTYTKTEIDEKLGSVSVISDGAYSIHADLTATVPVPVTSSAAKAMSSPEVVDTKLATTNDIPRFDGVYDFERGSNFTYHLYTALTNVIYAMGGSVTNTPNFN